MLWLELSGAEATTTQKSVRAAGMEPVVACVYQVPFEAPLLIDATSRKSTLSKDTFLD